MVLIIAAILYKTQNMTVNLWRARPTQRSFRQKTNLKGIYS